jgi:hypothetical protein
VSTWKSLERRIAAYLGGRRVPITGRQRGDTPDIEHTDWSVEVKHRGGKRPVWIADALDQAEASCDDVRLPMAVWHWKGEKVEDSVVMLSLKDFREWFGK